MLLLPTNIKIIRTSTSEDLQRKAGLSEPKNSYTCASYIIPNQPETAVVIADAGYAARVTGATPVGGKLQVSSNGRS